MNGIIGLDLFVMRKKISTYITAAMMLLSTAGFCFLEKLMISSGQETEGARNFNAALVSGITSAILIFGVFFVLFLGSDLKDGYIKNIAGSTKSRIGYIISKEIALAVYIVAGLAIVSLGAFLGSVLFLDGTQGFEALQFCKYLGVVFLLMLGFAVLMTFVVFLLRSTTGSMVIAVIVGSNLFANTAYRLIGMLLSKLDIEFNFAYISVTTQITSLRTDSSDKDMLIACAVAAGYIVIFNILTKAVMDKKDIA